MLHVFEIQSHFQFLLLTSLLATSTDSVQHSSLWYLKKKKREGGKEKKRKKEKKREKKKKEKSSCDRLGISEKLLWKVGDNWKALVKDWG